ncbi:MAG TPA: hypothetical protein VE028_04030 [Nitratidesulfovibrio sp.]|nr:hypothetical protein [Nitratidesulfovibrio sp.]
MDWLRWYNGTTTDPKFQVVARKSGQPVAFVLAVWAMLLERASSAEERGSVAGFDCEAADVLIGAPDGAACAIVQAMQARDMVVSDRIAKWECRQPKREREDKSTGRVQAYRARQADALHGVTPDVTPCNATKRHETPRLEEKREEDTSLNSKVLPKAEAVSNSTRSASAPSRPGAARTKKPADTLPPETGYRTKKGRILDGKRLDAFERFWSAFAYAKGKAEAADAWLDIPQLTEALVARIVAAAEREAAARPTLLASGRTPKMAQGWITARRWEDGEEPVPRAMSAAQQRLESNKAAGDEFLRMVQQQEAGHAR